MRKLLILFSFYVQVGFAQETHMVNVHINQEPCSVVAVEPEVSQGSQFSVYPVPAKNSFTIHSPFEQVSILLMDQFGTIILAERNETQTEVEISVGDLPRGIYLLRLRHKRGNDHFKILLQ